MYKLSYGCYIMTRSYYHTSLMQKGSYVSMFIHLTRRYVYYYMSFSFLLINIFALKYFNFVDWNLLGAKPIFVFQSCDVWFVSFQLVSDGGLIYTNCYCHKGKSRQKKEKTFKFFIHGYIMITGNLEHQRGEVNGDIPMFYVPTSLYSDNLFGL